MELLNTQMLSCLLNPLRISSFSIVTNLGHFTPHSNELEIDSLDCQLSLSKSTVSFRNINNSK